MSYAQSRLHADTTSTDAGFERLQREEDTAQTLFDAQKPVPLRQLLATRPFTWLECKFLGAPNRTLLLLERYTSKDTTLLVASVREPETPWWVEPHQVVRIGPELHEPAADSDSQRRAASLSHNASIPQKKSTTGVSKTYTSPRQAVIAINREIGTMISTATERTVFIHAVVRGPRETSPLGHETVRVSYYLNDYGGTVDGWAPGELVYALLADELKEKFSYDGLERVSFTRQALVLTWNVQTWTGA